MNFFCCGSSQRDTKQRKTAEIAFYDSDQTTMVQEFTYKKLADATKNFSLEYLVGEGSFGKVYRGKLQETGETVAVKQLNLDGLLGHREFLVQVTMMSLFNHPNLVNLIGYCVEGEERILVHEFLPIGSLHHYLHDRSLKQKPPLDWYTRIRIALGVARGLECIHHSSPPIIYLNLKPSNILLDFDFNAKLCNFKLAKIGPFSDKRINLEKVMLGAHGYIAPEYKKTGLLTVKTDVYSFGVVLLELISGRRAVDLSRPSKEQNLVSWVQQRLKKPSKFPELADPLLQCEYPVKGFNQALAIAAKCLHEEPSARPVMSDVVADLMCLTSDNFNDIYSCRRDLADLRSPLSSVDIGSFGNVYRGKLRENGEIVAIEHLDRNGPRGNREFLVQVLSMSILNHPNVINLIGYCTRGNERFLVHEYLPLGSLDKHLHDRSSQGIPPLDWYTRMKIALGTASALEYIHQKATPLVIYRNLKPSNILLDSDFNAKLSDFGLSKLAPTDDKEHVSARITENLGYVAPEYEKTGKLTVKVDVYSYGVVLLELITGRRAVDMTRPPKEQNLVIWAHQILKKPKKFPELADPLLQGNFPAQGFNKALAVAAMCLQEQHTARPMMSDVVAAIMFISSDKNLNDNMISPPLEAQVEHNNLEKVADEFDHGK